MGFGHVKRQLLKLPCAFPTPKGIEVWTSILSWSIFGSWTVSGYCWVSTAIDKLALWSLSIAWGCIRVLIGSLLLTSKDYTISYHNIIINAPDALEWHPSRLNTKVMKAPPIDNSCTLCWRSPDIYHDVKELLQNVTDFFTRKPAIYPITWHRCCQVFLLLPL